MQVKIESLKKSLGFWDSVAINVGIVIGVGIFRVPGEVARYLDTPFLMLAGWVAGGLIALLGVLCYAELASSFPHTGGTYVYLREAYGKPMGFIFGWMEFTIQRTGSIAAVAYIFTNYLGNALPFALRFEKLTAIFAVLFFTLLNIRGLHVGARVQSLLSFLKGAAIFAIAVLVFIFSKGPGGFQAPAPEGFHAGFFHYAAGMIPIIWAYGGWHESTFVTGEFRDTKKELPRSLVAGALIVMALYLLINTAYLKVLSPAEMAGQKAIAAEVLKRLFGKVGLVMITTAVLISSGGALNSTILTGGRIPFAVACDNPAMGGISRVHQGFGTPVLSLGLNALWACVLVLWGNFERLLFFTAFANWFFFTLAGIGVFILRRRALKSPAVFSAAQDTKFSMPGYPWVPVLFVGSSVLLCLTTILHAPRESLFGTCLILSGVPVYAFVQWKGRLKGRVGLS